MSGFNLGKFLNASLNPIKMIRNPIGALEGTLSPVTSLLGEVTGANAAQAQAAAIQAQTASQEAQYKQSLLQTQQANQLRDADTSNVASITAGGTAAGADDALSTATKKNRQALISSTLGIS